MNLTIVDTKSANFNSLIQAFKRLNIEPIVSDDINTIQKADKIILPGVGTASALMAGLLQLNVDEYLLNTQPELLNLTSPLIDFLLNTKKPILGICLGMQVQASKSYEVPLNGSLEYIPTLGIVNGDIHKLNAPNLALPHMGWNQIELIGEHPLFAGIKNHAYFYFVHSFALDVGDNTIAKCNYGQDFSAAIAKDNFMGVQFHPEKSGAIGAVLLQNFINL